MFIDKLELYSAANFLFKKKKKNFYYNLHIYCILIILERVGG